MDALSVAAGLLAGLGLGFFLGARWMADSVGVMIADRVVRGLW